MNKTHSVSHRKKVSEALTRLWKSKEYRSMQQRCRRPRKDRIVCNSYYKTHNPSHPRSDRDGYVFEHIPIAERKIGRALIKNEVVHHIDGDGWNNSPDNLVVITKKEHMIHHAPERDVRKVAGENNVMSKLTWLKVDKIRNLHKSGYSYGIIAYKFKVTKTQISNIINEKQWKICNRPHGVSLKATPLQTVPPSTP